MSDLPTKKSSGPDAEGLMTMNDPMKPFTQNDLAKNLHRMHNDEDSLSDSDHRWLSDYHGKKAKEKAPKEEDPYSALED